MEEKEKNNNDYEKYEHIFKIIYLIRINIPTSDYVYIIMYILKYIGIILFSISLNQWNIRPEQMDLKDDVINNNLLSILSHDNIYNFFSKFLINGNNLKILIYHYKIICIIGFVILLIYILAIIFGYIYMKKKYYNKNPITALEKKVKIFNKDSNFEIIFFKVIANIFFLIAFFHQYIIEYYIFGFIGFFLKVFGLYELSSFNKSNLDYIEYHLKDETINPLIITIINFISIILVIIIFISFMIINSSKTIFIENGSQLYSSKRYLLIKIIFFNLNPSFGIINTIANNKKTRIAIILMIIFLILIIIDFFLLFYQYSISPNRLYNTCIFIESFLFFSMMTELVLYLIDSNINIKEYNLIILFIILANAFVFTNLFIYSQNKTNMNKFSDNLFNKIFKKLYPNDIYYYIKAYLKYSEDKENNYIKIFGLIQSHILKCTRKECPCKILIPKEITNSRFTNLSANAPDESLNIDEKENISIDKDIPRKSKKNIKKMNTSNLLEKDIYKTHKSIKEQPRNLSRFFKIIENKKNSFKKKNTEKIGSISFFEEYNQNPLFRPVSKSKIKFEYNNMNNNQNIDINNNTNNDFENEKLNDEQFIMIGEQEIINRFNFLKKKKKYGILQDYIFIHLQYLIKIKQNYRLALYFVGKYSISNIKFNFLSKYCLYEIKKYICKNFICLKDSKIVKDPYILKYREENIAIQKLLNYVLLYIIIKKLIKTCCEKIIYFYTFRKELHNSLTLQKYRKTKIYPLLNSAEEMQYSISKLKYLIEKYYQNEKIPIESIELSYLICNFFKIIEGKVSQEILRYIFPLLNFKEFHYAKLSEEFNHFLMNNPLIINLTKKDTFNILYFTNVFLDKLGFSYTDLKNKDFHEKLFPGGQDFIKEHTLLMKEFLFYSKNSFSKEKTFIKSKEGFLTSINFNSRVFPTFKDNFFLISNIVFNDNALADFNNNNNNSIENKATSKFNSDNINIYAFLLDYHFDFLGLTKNFYLEYELNQGMFRELRINFCQFFCINENRLIDKIIKERKKLLAKYPALNQKISLRESNRAYTIFQNIKSENIFKIRNVNFIENFFYPSISIYDKIDKKKLIYKIPEIINLIDEIGLDYDWYIKLQNFKEKMINNSKLQNIKETGISSVTNYNMNNKGDDHRQSTIVEPNFFEYNFKNSPWQYFEVIYSFRKLGSVSYYIVNLLEKINNIDETQIAPIQNEKEEIVLNRRNSSANFIMSKNFKRLCTQRSIKFKERSASKTLEEENQEEPAINKKSNTKVFFPIISVQTLSNNNKIMQSKKIEEKLNKKNSLDIEIIKSNNNKVIKKEEAKNNFKRISNEFPKKQKLLKTFHYKEYIKSEIKKKITDEDENTPLIPKDEFNKILKQLNKKNKIFIIILSIIILICFLLVIIKFNMSMVGLEQSITILLSTIYLEMIKVDIFSLSILSIIYCINDNNITQVSNIHSNAKEKNQMIIEHLKLFQNNFNKLINNKNCLGIYDILSKNIEIWNLNIDWNTSPLQAGILKEIRRLEYSTYGLIYNNESCNISVFYDSFEKQKLSGNKPNSIQRIIYYFIQNTLSAYKNVFTKLAEECVISIESMFMAYHNIIFYLLISIIILLIVFIISYIIKVCYDYSFYQLLFLYYYHIEKEQLKFENNIYYLYKSVLEFNYININYFEYLKNKSLYYYDDNNNNNSNNLFTIIRNNIFNSLKKGNNKINNFSKKISIEKDKNKINEQNNNESMLNGSMNGSSLQFLKNSNNHKTPLNALSNNSNFSISSRKEEKEDSIDSLLKISNKILPNSLKISLIFILIGVLAYFSILFGNLYESRRENRIWQFSINLSMNILERNPRLMAMLIYSCIAIILNDPDIIKGSPLNDNQPNFMKFFEVNSLYYSEDIMNKYFKENYFGELLRDILRINYNINNYLSQGTNNIFKMTRYWESLFNKKGYFCIYGAMGKLLFIPYNDTNYNFIKQIESDSLFCKEQNFGVDESGVSLEINYITLELTNKYIDFITSNRSNSTITEARKRFFGSKDIKRIFNDIYYPLNLYFNTITNAVFLDFENQSNNLIHNQALFDLFLFLVNISIIICLLTVITKGEKYKQLFAYFLEFPKSYNN